MRHMPPVFPPHRAGRDAGPVSYTHLDVYKRQAQVLAAMPYDRLAAFWEDLGVPLRLEEEGRVYPASFLASAAVDLSLIHI